MRELRNVIERACMLAEGDLINERDVMAAAKIGRPAAEEAPTITRRAAPGESDRLDLVERDHILSILERTRGNKSEAARALGVSRRAFYRKLDRHGLGGPRSEPARGTDRRRNRRTPAGRIIRHDRPPAGSRRCATPARPAR